MSEHWIPNVHRALRAASPSVSSSFSTRKGQPQRAFPKQPSAVFLLPPPPPSNPLLGYPMRSRIHTHTVFFLAKKQHHSHSSTYVPANETWYFLQEFNAPTSGSALPVWLVRKDCNEKCLCLCLQPTGAIYCMAKKISSKGRPTWTYPRTWQHWTLDATDAFPEKKIGEKKPWITSSSPIHPTLLSHFSAPLRQVLQSSQYYYRKKERQMCARRAHTHMLLFCRGSTAVQRQSYSSCCCLCLIKQVMNWRNIVQ